MWCGTKKPNGRDLYLHLCQRMRACAHQHPHLRTAYLLAEIASPLSVHCLAVTTCLPKQLLGLVL